MWRAFRDPSPTWSALPTHPRRSRRVWRALLTPSAALADAEKKAVYTITNAANTKSIDQALPDYIKAVKMLVNDVVWITIDYGTQPYLVQPYVRGAGYNGLYDYNWQGIKLLQH